MSPPFLPLYVADYLSATTHLNAAESGAYLHLLMHYWQKGSLPKEDRFLARIARMTDRQWAAAKPVLSSFFDGDWVQSRLEKERAKAIQKAEARAEYGSHGGHVKALNSKKASVAKAKPEPEVCHQQNDSKPLPFSQDIHTQEDRPLESKAPKALRSSRKRTPSDVLSETIGADMAQAVVEHRQRIRKPLTAFAADLLAESLRECADPAGAARTMIERGWMTIKPGWGEPRAPPINGHSRQQTNLQLDIIAQEIYDERQRRSGS